MRVKGRSFDSLFDYYRTEYPELAVEVDSPAVRVSFPGLDRPQFVDATRVRARVMNEEVPANLSHVDKLAPGQRRGLVQRFWQQLGTRPFGRVAPGVSEGFWQPQGDRKTYLLPPALIFGNGRRLEAPPVHTPTALRDPPFTS